MQKSKHGVRQSVANDYSERIDVDNGDYHSVSENGIVSGIEISQYLVANPDTHNYGELSRLHRTRTGKINVSRLFCLAICHRGGLNE
jgi:hypothetical protein